MNRTKQLHRMNTFEYQESLEDLMDSTVDAHPAQTPHTLFSAENALHTPKVKMSHDQVLNALRKRGINFEEVQGKYGKPERSIMVLNPTKKQRIFVQNTAQKLGQDSVIHSDGKDHIYMYVNGEKTGKYHKGKGTQFHESEPMDDYTKMKDGSYFTHNINFDHIHSDDVNKNENNPEIKDIFNTHPREYYKEKRDQEKRKIIAERERKRTGAKKPLDAAMDKLKELKEPKIDKYEDLSQSEFVDEEELLEKTKPQYIGENHPSQPWQAKQHSLGDIMWSANKEQSDKIDSFIRNKENHQKILSTIPKTHKQAYIDMVNQVGKDPDRHFIPSQHGLGGEQKVRARHLRSLLLGDPSVKIDTSDPNRLTIHRQSHTKGTGQPNISIHFPTKGSNEIGKGNVQRGVTGAVPAGQGIEKSESRGSRAIMGENWLGNKPDSKPELAKGSLQRRNPFNPNQDVQYEDASKIAHWQEGDGDREVVPSINRISPEARARAIHKLHSRTEVRRHPKTGERMFLLHRGVENKEKDPHKNQKSSWTPHLHIAGDFAENYGKEDNLDGHVISAWIPESQIHNIPTQLGSLSSGDSDGQNYFSDEHEVIVKPHDFIYAKKQKLPKQKSLDEKISANISNRYGKKTSKSKQQSAAENPLHPSKFEDKLAASEIVNIDITKGSLQRRNPFNPNDRKNEITTSKQRRWTHDEEDDDRQTLPKMEGSARIRALNKLMAQTHVRKDPSTGERLFLMHRGMGKEEFNGSHNNNVAQYEKGVRTSWTPDRKVADSFSAPRPATAWKGADNPSGYTVSAWIPESAIVHSVNQFNAPSPESVASAKEFNKVKSDGPIKIQKQNNRSITEKDENECIIEHNQPFHHANPSFIDRLNRDKLVSTWTKTNDSTSPDFKGEIGAKQFNATSQLAPEDKDQAYHNALNAKAKIGSEDKIKKVPKLKTKLAASENTEPDLKK